MRRIGLLALAVGFLLPTFGDQSPGLAGASLMGDADCSGAVNPVDGLAVLRHDSGTAAAPCVELADVQCDGDVDPIDALQLLRWDAGLDVTQEEGCAEIGELAGGPPSSEELIAEALGRGDITYEESLLYRGYALYDHPELPNEFRSEIVDYHAAGELLLELDENQGSLSADLLQDLAPFTARPADPVSIFNNPPGASASSVPQWVSMPAAGGAARVWVPDGPQAQSQLQTHAEDATRIWSALSGVFRYGIPDTPGTSAVNPDDAIDIYVAPVNTVDPRQGGCDVAPQPPSCVLTWGGGFTGYTAPYTTNTSASYVMIASTLTGVAFTKALAHELMHVGQHAYDYHEALWLKDATANWGAWRVLQKLGEPRQPLFDLLPGLFAELDKTLTREGGYLEHTRYRAWLYFMFASMEEGDGVVTSIWENAAASGVQNARAVDNVFPFDSNFDNFTVRNWNEEPVSPRYKDSPGDSTFPESLHPSAPNIHFASPDVEQLDIGLEPLSAEYRAFTFDQSVRTVVFENKWVGQQNWHVWALMKVKDEWKEPVDWSDESQKEFCRDRPSEDITELVLIVSNSHMTSSITPSSDAEVEGKGEGCSGWEGTVTINGTGQATIESEHNGVYTGTVTGVRFEQNQDFPTVFNLTAGTAHWTVSGTRFDSCDGTMSGEFIVDFASDFGEEWFSGSLLLDPFNDILYDVSITTNRPPAVEVWDCEPPNEGFSGEHPWGPRLDPIPNTTETMDLELTGEPGSRVAAGEFSRTQNSGFAEVTYSWQFQEYGGGQE